MFKVIMANIEIAITPPRIARLRSNLIESLSAAQREYYKWSRSEVKGQGHNVT